MTVVRLKIVLTAVALLLASAPCVLANSTSPLQKSVAVEYTFLKSNPGDRQALKKFIVNNWFAMDRIAVEKGLMSSYEVLETEDDTEPWNIVVAVTYTNRAGYEGITEEFEKIRQRHKTTMENGKNLRDLGRIVLSRKLYRELP